VAGAGAFFEPDTGAQALHAHPTRLAAGAADALEANFHRNLFRGRRANQEPSTTRIMTTVKPPKIRKNTHAATTSA
jgi:hypothetical protein